MKNDTGRPWGFTAPVPSVSAQGINAASILRASLVVADGVVMKDRNGNPGRKVRVTELHEPDPASAVFRVVGPNGFEDGNFATAADAQKEAEYRARQCPSAIYHVVHVLTVTEASVTTATSKVVYSEPDF